MESINFATYYRPMTFSEVVGQDTAKTVLKKIASTPGISVRSIFLKGSYGSGKSTLARIFGRAMNCEKFKETGEVCNECAACKEVLAKNSQLYFEFDASVAGNVDTIRNLHDKFAYLPNGRRVVVFDECHSASKAALNALLKMVEDGVPDTIFVFASTEDILPTIKSRSLCLDISTIPQNLIVQRLKDISISRGLEIPDNVANLIASKSFGHMRDALSLYQLYTLSGEEGLKSSYSLIVKFFKLACTKQKDAALSVLREILSFNVVDIKNSIKLFIKNCFLAESNDPLYPFVHNGIIHKIYSFTYNPVQQEALKDEVGVELYFRVFLDKICGQPTNTR